MVWYLRLRVCFINIHYKTKLRRSSSSKIESDNQHGIASVVIDNILFSLNSDHMTAIN